MNYKTLKPKLDAAEKLLFSETTSAAKVASVSALLKGIHPKIDGLLAVCDKEIEKLDKMEKGAIIELTAEHLPQHTEEQKKRKRILLFFLKHWNELKSEVKRIEAELEKSKHDHSPGQKALHARNIIGFAKGPLGLITIVAAGIVALKMVSVQVVIKNQGCNSLQIPVTLPVPIPGLSLPAGPITDGSWTVATLPPVNVTVDGTTGRMLEVTLAGKQFGYSLMSQINDVTFDGGSLLGKKTDIALGSSKEHVVVVRCD